MARLLRCSQRINDFYYPPRPCETAPGKVRNLSVPKPELKEIQKRIDRRILKRVALPDEIHGYRKKRSIKTAAFPHIGKKAIARLDIKDFFPSISPKKIYGLFCVLGCSPDVARLLTLLTTHENQLPQGTSTSPSLANLVLANSGLAVRLHGLARIHNLSLGFYGDDIFLSGEFVPEHFKKLLVKIVSQCGLRVNPKKLETKFARYSHQRQEGLGLTLNRKPNVSKDYLRKLRVELHACRTRGPSTQIPPGKTGNWLRAHILGKIQHLRWLNEELGDKYLLAFQKIEW